MLLLSDNLREVMLIKRFEDDLPSVGTAPNKRFVAQMNSFTVLKDMYFEKKAEFFMVE
ncbi:hypothetical protein [Paenibacillus sp. MMO-177]|uniref:hypothetical protein n=1 Tax=Paenibacillus sp. MMO-177 TaxID=3081289 RepID=UPI0030175AEA